MTFDLFFGLLPGIFAQYSPFFEVMTSFSFLLRDIRTRGMELWNFRHSWNQIRGIILGEIDFRDFDLPETRFGVLQWNLDNSYSRGPGKMV